MSLKDENGNLIEETTPANEVNEQQAPAPESGKELSAEDIDNMSLEELDKFGESLKSKDAPEKRDTVETDEEKTVKEVSQKQEPQKETKQPEDFKVRFEESQKMIGKQSNEIGELRKLNGDLIAELQELKNRFNKPPAPEVDPEKKRAEYREKILDEPDKVIKDIVQSISQEKENEITRQMSIRKNNAEKYAKAYPEIFQDKAKAQQIENTIIEVLKDDGYSAEDITKIQRDPFVLPHELLNEWTKRAQMQIKLKELEQKINTNTSLPDRINQAAKAQSIVAQPGQGVPVKAETLSDAEIANLSPEQIDGLLKKFTGK